MKTKNMLWAVLSLTAVLVMTACSSDDNDIVETPAAPQAQKTIPYTVTVSDDATTRATVSDDPMDRQLYFATGDKLYITGADIKGVLDLQAGDEGKATGATFSGELTYSGSGSPADDLSLTATLVSAQQTVGTQVSVDAAGAVTVNYPSTAYCATINDAVQQYSRLTGTSTYGAKAFTLTQQTAFLNFEITFEDGTATDTELSAVVSNGGSAVCTANVTTVTAGGVKAKFVLPLAAGTTLSSATVTMGDKEAISFGASQTLTGKVYNVRKTQAAPAPTYTMAANATAEDKGKLICTAGHIHAYNADAECAATRVAKIIYLGATGHATYTHGLALAFKDEGQEGWDTAMPRCSNKNTSDEAVTNALWMLPSRDQWNYMLGPDGAGSNTALLDVFNGITDAKNLYDFANYWSSTEDDNDNTKAWSYNFYLGKWNDEPAPKLSSICFRACLAF